MACGSLFRNVSFAENQLTPERILKPQLSQLAHIAEVIGAAAIVVSLVYVGIEINENSRAVRSAMAKESTTAVSAWYTALGSNQQATHAFRVGMVEPEALSEEELAQFFYLAHGLMLEYQSLFYISREGTLDQALQDSITRTLSATAHLAGFQMYWKQRREIFYPEFRERVEEIIAAGPDSGEFQRLYTSPNSE